jgi:hypothetical protein
MRRRRPVLDAGAVPGVYLEHEEIVRLLPHHGIESFAAGGILPDDETAQIDAAHRNAQVTNPMLFLSSHCSLHLQGEYEADAQSGARQRQADG